MATKLSPVGSQFQVNQDTTNRAVFPILRRSATAASSSSIRARSTRAGRHRHPRSVRQCERHAVGSHDPCRNVLAASRRIRRWRRAATAASPRSGRISGRQPDRRAPTRTSITPSPTPPAPTPSAARCSWTLLSPLEDPDIATMSDGRQIVVAERKPRCQRSRHFLRRA